MSVQGEAEDGAVNPLELGDRHHHRVRVELLRWHLDQAREEIRRLRADATKAEDVIGAARAFLDAWESDDWTPADDGLPSALRDAVAASTEDGR